MRFNTKELAVLAQQKSSQFDREGFLMMKQKVDKLFKKEAFVEKYFRLRGNLLFYFKGKDSIHKSDPQGVLVLERCTVELDTHESTINFSFVIIFEGDEITYTFSAKTEADRDHWIQALHEASYECLKMQLLSLREQVQARTGQDPLAQMLPVDTGMEFETRAVNDANDPAMEISISIDGLPNDSNGLPPNPFVVLYSIVPPQQQNWLQHNHTEMVEKNNSPHFLKTIGFGDSSGFEPNTRVKVTVYHVKERMTGTMSQIGQVIFILNDILLSQSMSLKLALQSTDSSKVGEMTIVAWMNESNESVRDLQNSAEPNTAMDNPRYTRSLSFVRRSRCLDSLKVACENICTRTFRFETNDGVRLLVHEYMGESKLAFDLPIKLLKLFIDEEQARIKQLQDLGQLPLLLESHVAADISLRANIVTEYTDHINILACYRGSSFKPSSKKADKELEFVPVNLHLQRMTVLNEVTQECGNYDTVTTGGFIAYARKFRDGGLVQLLKKQQEHYTAEGTLSKVSKVRRGCELLNSLYTLQTEIVVLCDRVCQEALQGDGESLHSATKQLEHKVKDLILDCQSSLIQEAAGRLADIHEEFQAIAEEQERLTGQKPDSQPPDMKWKWTGSDFVKSPTIEPWDMTRVNTEAALVCLTSMVEDLVHNRSGAMDRPKWLGEISPAVIKLKSFVEIVCQKATHFMSFLDLVEHKENLKLMHTIKCRRDIVFSQALTSCVTGIALHLHTNMDNSALLQQIGTLGMLVQMEGLLSCHGDEMAMLEDLIVAMDDITTVTFKVVPESQQNSSVELSTTSFKKAGMFPDLSRHHICVEIPFKKSQLEKFPAILHSGVKVIPVFFNIGINEQATLAEKFGSTSLQDKTNEESLGRLYKYVKHYEQIYHTNTGGVGTVPALMQQLHNNVYTKKSKNVEILHLAAELCEKLHGVRMTSCKSGKDRTAMSVTLEQVQILQREHNLASHVFMQSLDCFRSEGCRRENTYKNIGHRKYAFNSLQLLSFPKQYRPPNGTYGNVQG